MFTKFRHMTPAEIESYYNDLEAEKNNRQTLMQKVLSRHSTAKMIVMVYSNLLESSSNSTRIWHQGNDAKDEFSSQQQVLWEGICSTAHYWR